MMKLLMQKLTVKETWRTPFDDTAEGFNPRWWLSMTFSKDDDCWTFSLNGVEVARALINRGTINNVYENLTPAPSIVDIVLFEVRAQYRNKGIGHEAVSLILERYPNEMITAFSEQADEFWSSVGFRYHQRTDDERTRPLFVYDDTSLSD